MSTSVQSKITISFDSETGTSSPVQVSYRFEHNVVELKQGEHVIWLPFEDASDFVAILNKWVQENT